MNYFLLPKNANKREGNERSQTDKVITNENAAIKGYDKINNTSNATVPAVIGLFRFAIILPNN